MNKKFLSAILFGALMVTSTGTFVSCKDYDEDIENLQGQVDANKNAIAALQQLVGSGNWVTGVAGGADGLVVTMSNGSTVTVPTGNGKDGKDGTEWTIGEDGYWYMDGEKTDNLAVPQGVAGSVVAPSPTIENGKWVIYTWDAEKGEYVAEVTEISAAGTSSYVVLKNGAYILNIADETGEFVEISLPATAESFTISAIANKNVLVNFTYGEWKTPTTKKDKEVFDKLAAVFPALEEYEDGQFVAQNNKLPFMVSPANVQLTKEHTFALISLKGEDAGATLTNPTLGMPSNVSLVNSRSAEGTAVWSVDFEPAKNEKGKYVEDKRQDLYSLVVSGPKGIIAATPYVYYYDLNPVGKTFELRELTGWTRDGIDLARKVYNENGMDLLTLEVEDENAEFIVELPTTALNDTYIFEATDPAQVEKYGIKVEGSVVTLANMPKTESVYSLEMKVTTISVNGVVAEKDFLLDVTTEIAATGALADKDEVLTGTYDKKGNFSSTNQKIWWSLEDLKLSALQKQDFVTAGDRRLEIRDAENNVVNVEPATVTIYEADKTTEVTADTYMKAAYIYTVVDAASVVPGDYTVVLSAKNNTTVIKAESNLTLSNPEENLWSIDEAYLNEEGVVIAAVNAPYDFNLNKIFVGLDKAYTIAGIEDVDYVYENDPTTFPQWLTSLADDNDYVNYTINAGKANFDVDPIKTEVDKVRTLKVTFNLFGNGDNQQEAEIKVKWTSTIYAEDATDVLTVDAAKMKIKFDDVASTTTVDESKVSLSSIVTKAVWAQGALKGQKYTLFSTPASGGGYKYKYTDYNDYAKDAEGKYPLNASSTPIEIAAADLVKFGMTVEQYTAYVGLGEDAPKIYLTIADQTVKFTAGEKTYSATLSGWTSIYAEFDKYYNLKKDADNTYVLDEDYEEAPTSNLYSLFNTYKGSLVCKEKETGVITTASGEVNREAEIKYVTLKYVNANDAVYFTSTLSEDLDNAAAGFTFDAKASDSIDRTSLVEGKKVVPMQLIITDVWGKEMVYEFNIEISL